MIPTIGSIANYEINPTEYMRAADNGLIGFANGIINLANSAIGTPQYIYQKGLPTVGKEMGEYLQDMGSDALAYVKNEWDYFLNTPLDKQFMGALNNVFGPKALATYTNIGAGVIIGNALSKAAIGFNTTKAAATSYADDAAGAGKTFVQQMTPEETARYNQYWENLTKRAPEQSSPYNIINKYSTEGQLKSVTTYDEFGNRAYQYEFGNVRHGEGYHYYDNTGQYMGTGKGPRSEHIDY